MADPISDSGLVKLRSIIQGGTRGEMHASVPIDVLASILARLERAEAKLPVLIETIRKGCDAERCIFCGWDWRDCVQHRPSDCPGIAALKAAGEEP